ncbi:FAD-linked oxidase [Nocardioides sp. Soil777]|uniref:FAD-binding oxidoreductase n=1 Tax=Nocardioides sp. Soil777 TaxID=1736409 RepID=UPI000702C864|nr:FAD-linked oxidase C-terminal domain-containing protein [Nocardioides sp. Soil777]KRF07551.1 FAD-linked oxidase [Nocardioides sp. Soil777]
MSSAPTTTPTTRPADALPALVAALPDDVVVTDAARTEKYRWDRSQDPHVGTPLAVVRAEDAAQVQTAVRWAAEHGVPVVPRGTGTGLSGGASAVDGGIVLSLERMTDVQVDTACQVVVVGPGALNKDVKAAAARHGLWYPPDPSSYEICSIGGNIATNAGGLCCVKYGVTSDYVLGLDVVLADGTLVTLGGPRIKDVAGLSLLQLFVGSEGTLGVVTRAILRLEPEQAVGATMVAAFPTMSAAAEAVVAIRRRLRPSMLELMDQPSIRAVEAFRPMGLDTDAGALLVAQSDAPGTACGVEVEAMRAACEAAGSTDVFVTEDADEGELFVQARRLVVPAVEPLGELMLEDVGVPVPRLPELVDAVAAVAARHDLLIPVVAHAGDGNTHPLIVVPRGDEEARLRALAAFDEIMHAAIGLGGTITGEHGVGRTKRSALPAQLGDDVMALTRRVKDALDPAGILNPGAILEA